MKKILVVMIAAFFLSASFPALHADEMASRLQAIILVKKAVAFLKENGRNKALEEFSNPSGRFAVQDHYIFAYETSGKCVANAADRNMVGRTLIGIAVRNSKAGTQDQAQEAMKNEIGWQYCVFTDPVNNKTAKRIAYLEKVDDIIIGCGNSR
jgi:signal transduction histidine kinase